MKDNGKNVPGCVCPEGLFLLNGICVEAEKCFETGWTEWGVWSECDHHCSQENGKRFRNKFHRTDGDIQMDEEICYNDCK